MKIATFVVLTVTGMTTVGVGVYQVTPAGGFATQVGSSTASPSLAAPAISVTYRASVADCVEPGRPDPDACEREVGPGVMTVDLDMESTRRQRHVFMRFDLDDAVAGRTVRRVTLRLRSPENFRAGGPHSGELWEVTPFTRAELFRGLPPAMGAAALVPGVGAVASGSVAEFELPVELVRPGGCVFLALVPRSRDGVDYYGARGAEPPSLTIEAGEGAASPAAAAAGGG